MKLSEIIKELAEMIEESGDTDLGTGFYIHYTDGALRVVR